MSELKELAWTVQEGVRPLPFEELRRRGVRRRHRRQALTGAGIALVAAVAFLAALLPGNSRDGLEPPVATPSGATVITAADATLEDFAASAGNFWGSTWSSCTPTPCRYAARLNIAGLTADTPITDRPIAVMPTANETIAVLPPKASPLSATDPTWKQSFVMQLSDGGRVLRPLQYAAPTSTFSSGEILGQLTGTEEVTVLNTFEMSLRTLRLPADLRRPRLPVRGISDVDRWWLIADAPGGGTQIAWTADGGHSSQRHKVAGSRPTDGAGAVSTSSFDGRATVAVTKAADGSTRTMERSLDAGRSWQQIADPPARISGAMPFSDGTTIIIGRRPGDARSTTYVLDTEGRITRGAAAPSVAALSGYGTYLYGLDSVSTVALSRDWGTTWDSFEPR